MYCSALNCTSFNKTVKHLFLDVTVSFGCCNIQFSLTVFIVPLYIALHCSTLHCTALQCTALHCTAMQCTVSSLGGPKIVTYNSFSHPPHPVNYSNILHYTLLHYTTLHYTALHYITLQYTALHYIVPYCVKYTILYYASAPFIFRTAILKNSCQE